MYDECINQFLIKIIIMLTLELCVNYAGMLKLPLFLRKIIRTFLRIYIINIIRK